MAFKGTHNVASRGSSAWRQRLKTSPKQKVTAGSLLVVNAKRIRCGENTYLRKHNIHAKVNGTVQINNSVISVQA